MIATNNNNEEKIITVKRERLKILKWRINTVVEKEKFSLSFQE